MPECYSFRGAGLKLLYIVNGQAAYQLDVSLRRVPRLQEKAPVETKTVS